MQFLTFVILFCVFDCFGGQPPEVFKKPEISSLHIYSDIKYRYATTRVTSRIKNADTKTREAIFDVTLPDDAFITNLTLEIDGKIVLGEIKGKEVAKQQYEAAKHRGESAGYIGTRHRETNRFSLAVAVAPQSKVYFNLTYQELLKRKHGHYEQVIYIDPGQPVPDMDITVVILESREITLLRVPPLRNDVNADIEDLSTITVISQPTAKTAEIKFVPSIEHQTAQSASGMAGQFVVQYDVEREMDAGDVLLVNGYFVHFFAPEGFTPIPNDVLFILDTSGSMSGTKLVQLKEALQSILQQLNDGDRINMMTFSGSTSFWKTTMVDIHDEDSMEEAKLFIGGLSAGGWTNIDLALTDGIDFLGNSVTAGEIRSPVIVFLTDGEATQGVTNSNDILSNVRRKNEGEIPIFTLAFGQYADYDLVKKIAIQNNGIGRKIYEASDAAMQIAGFYNEISVTLLSNVTFHYLDAPVSDVTQHTYTNYFNGSELVVCGRLPTVEEENDISLNFKITSNSVKMPGLVVTGLSDRIIDIPSNETDFGDFEKITEKVWAYLTIKQLLDKELGAVTADEKTAFKQKALDLSLKYGFVTPLTSMVVTLPESSEIRKPEVIHADDKPSPAADVLSSSVRNTQGGMHHSVPRPDGLAFNPRRYFVPHFHAFNTIPFRFPATPSFLIRNPNILPATPSFLIDAPNLLPATHFDVDVYDSQPVGKLGGTGDMHTKSKKTKNRKNNRKNKKRDSALSYPLTVQFPNIQHPLCFNLYDSELTAQSDRYRLYADTKGLSVVVQLESRTQGKWTKQGGVRKIILADGKTNRILTNESFTETIANDDSLPWTVSVLPSTDADMLLIELQEFNIIVTNTEDGYLMLNVDRSAHQTALQGNGIIDQIWAKNVVFIKELKRNSRKKNRTKHLGLFKADGKKFPGIMRNIGKNGAERCWSMRAQKEAAFVDLSTQHV